MSAINQLPNVASRWERLSYEAQAEIMAGALAVRRIREHEDYGRWVQAGRALLRLQDEAMRLSGSNGPFGRGYTAARGELGDRVPDLENLDNASKAHAVWLAKNFAVVDPWRKNLAVNERDRLNHPSVVKRRYEAAHTVKEDKPPAIGKKDQALIDIQQESDTLSSELEAAQAHIAELENEIHELRAHHAPLAPPAPDSAAASPLRQAQDSAVWEPPGGLQDARIAELEARYAKLVEQRKFEREQYEQRGAISDQLRKERDALLAENAKLKAQVKELEEKLIWCIDPSADSLEEMAKLIAEYIEPHEFLKVFMNVAKPSPTPRQNGTETATDDIDELLASGVGVTKKTKFPFGALQVGRSFIAPYDRIPGADDSKKQNYVLSLIAAFRRTHPDMKFTTHLTDKGVLVTRVQ